MMKETLKQLCALPGVSSYEDAVRDYLMQQAKPHVLHQHGIHRQGA